jgi:glyoxylase-like metal-dependent hydrolase (beta-lactamase superfamily II)
MQSYRKIVLALGVVAAGLGAAATAAAQLPNPLEAPAGFIPPPLHPAGVRLETRRMAEGVYALVSSRIPVDNSGFVVGDRGVLVIDAHINGEMARAIQAAVREVTDKPILYLVNTNYHGDHTFGNYAFPSETQIVAHRATAEQMKQFEREKQFLLATVNHDPTVYGDVRLRLPDIVFDDQLRLDLGGRIVELYHFGPGNTQGDAVVNVPDAGVAWTGNLVLGTGAVPFLIEGGAEDYLETIERFAATLDVESIVPGHGPILPESILDGYRMYLSDLIERVPSMAREGRSLDATLEAVTLDERFLPPGADAPTRQFINGIHRFNVWRVFDEATSSNASEAVGR